MVACLSAKPFGRPKKKNHPKKNGTNQRKVKLQAQTEKNGYRICQRERRGDFKVINLDLRTPPRISFLVGQWRPSCHSPEIIRKSLFMPLLDSGGHEMSLTLEYLVFR